MLQELDFNDSLVNPMDNKEEILIEIYIENYENNKTILTVLQDATIKNDDGKEVLKISYRFFPYQYSQQIISSCKTVYGSSDYFCE